MSEGTSTVRRKTPLTHRNDLGSTFHYDSAMYMFAMCGKSFIWGPYRRYRGE